MALPTDSISLTTLLFAQAAMLVTPGPNLIALSGAATRSLRHGLAAAAVLASVVALFASATVLLGTTLSPGSQALRALAVIGAVYLCYVASRRLVQPRQGGLLERPPRVTTCIEVGLTSLTNPYAIVFYGGVMLPAASLQDGRCSLLVACMAATALTIYGAFAFIFSHPRVRRVLDRNRRLVDVATAGCLALFGGRLLAAAL